MGKKTSLDYIWKNGIAIPHQESQALVMADMERKVIHIRTMGRHRAYLLSAIRKDFRQQLDRDLSVTVRVSNDNVHYVTLCIPKAHMTCWTIYIGFKTQRFEKKNVYFVFFLFSK